MFLNLVSSESASEQTSTVARSRAIHYAPLSRSLSAMRTVRCVPRPASCSPAAHCVDRMRMISFRQRTTVQRCVGSRAGMVATSTASKISFHMVCIYNIFMLFVSSSLLYCIKYVFYDVPHCFCKPAQMARSPVAINLSANHASTRLSQLRTKLEVTAVSALTVSP